MKTRTFKQSFLMAMALMLLAATFALAQSQPQAQSQSGASKDAANQQSKYNTPAEVAVEFGRFFDLLDKDRDGAVTVAEMLDAHNAQDDPKAVARIKAWDRNRNGRIERQEAADGVKADLMTVVDEQMKVDSDGDGILSVAEYTLAVPDPHSDKTASGLTKRQEIMFRSADNNKDDKYSREEAIAANSYRWTHSYRGRYAAYRARVFDLNRDRQYDLAEFALIYGVKPGEPVPQAIQEKFKGQGASVSSHSYYNVMMRIIHFPLAEMDELDQRVTAYEKHHAAANPKAAVNENKH
ncbi:MAG: hypothetical protein MOB07_02800 [Acidobacteria bacterium]|nr:hypothetical protein [Acidobacteriota bacterium]